MKSLKELGLLKYQIDRDKYPVSLATAHAQLRQTVRQKHSVKGFRTVLNSLKR